MVTPIVTAAPSDRSALVSPTIVGQPAAGYLPMPYDIVPSTVTLTGDPAILVGTTVLHTEPIDVNGLTRDRSFKVRLLVPIKLHASPQTVTHPVPRSARPLVSSRHARGQPLPREPRPSLLRHLLLTDRDTGALDGSQADKGQRGSRVFRASL